MTEHAAKPAHTPNPDRPERPRRIRKWMHQHERALALIGAAIVFGTFIIKDAFKEQIGDLVSSIDKAQNVFLLRNDMSEIRNQIQAVQVMESQRPYMIGGTVKVDPSILSVRFTIQLNLARSDHDHSKTAIAACEQLLDKLPKTIQMQDESALKEVNAALQDMEEQFTESYKLYTGAPIDTLAAARISQKIQDDEILLQVRMSALVEKILKQAQDTNTVNQRDYEVATWVSWFLYALGWGLGLVSRLAGVEGIGGE